MLKEQANINKYIQLDDEKGQYENITESNWISNPNNVVNMEDDDETSALNAHIRAKANLGYHAHTRRRLV